MQRVESRPRRVLVVEDDAFLLELITTRLELAGFDTRAARDGSQALKRLSEFRPEAMVIAQAHIWPRTAIPATRKTRAPTVSAANNVRKLKRGAIMTGARPGRLGELSRSSPSQAAS